MSMNLRRIATAGAVRAIKFVDEKRIILAIANDLWCILYDAATSEWKRSSCCTFHPLGGATVTKVDAFKLECYGFNVVIALGAQGFRVFHLYNEESNFTKLYEVADYYYTPSLNLASYVIEHNDAPRFWSPKNKKVSAATSNYFLLIESAHCCLSIYYAESIAQRPEKHIYSLARLQCNRESLIYSATLTLSHFLSPHVPETSILCCGGSVDGQILFWMLSRDNLIKAKENKENKSFEHKHPMTILPLHTSTMAHKGAIFALRFSPDHTILASASDDREIRLWTYSCNKSNYNFSVTLRNVLKGEHRSRIWELQWIVMKNEFYLVSAGEDSTALIWDISNGTCTQRLIGHVGRGVWSVSTISCSSTGIPLVATGGADGDAKVWTVEKPFLIENKEILETGNERDCPDSGKDEENNYMRGKPRFKKYENTASYIGEKPLLLDIRKAHSSISKKDWVRDILLIHQTAGFFITNFGGLGYFELSKRHISYNKEQQLQTNIDTTELHVPEYTTFPYLLTSFASVVLTSGVSKDFYEGRKRLFFVGTSCGKVLIICSNRLCSILDVYSHHRVHKVFGLLVANNDLHDYTNVMYDEPLVFVIATNHLGHIKIYQIEYDGLSIRTINVADVCLDPLSRRILRRRIFSAAGCTLNTYSNTVSSLSAEHKSVLIKTLLFVFGDEHSDLHTLKITIGYPLVTTELPSTSSLLRTHNLPDTEIFHHMVLSKKSNIHQKSKIWSIEIISCNDEYQVVTTGGDGCFVRFQIFNQEKNVLIETQPEVNKSTFLPEYAAAVDLRWTYSNPLPHVNCILNLIYDQEDSSLVYAATVNAADFILWGFSGSAEVWRFKCGGSRRPFSVNSGILKLQNKYYVSVAYAQAHTITLRTKYFDLFKNDYRSAKLSPVFDTISSISSNEPLTENNDTVNCFARGYVCCSLLSSFHGRETLCGVWLADDLLLTGGEDNTLRLSQIQPLANSALNVISCKQKLAYYHSAAVRCITKIMTSEGIFMVSAGARQTVNLFWKSASPGSFVLHLLKDQLKLEFDERIVSIVSYKQENSHSPFAITIHVFLGTSSGRILWRPLLIDCQNGNDNRVLPIAIGSAPIIVEGEKSAKGYTPYTQLDQRNVALISCSIDIEQVGDTHIGILTFGAVNGFIFCYSISIKSSNMQIFKNLEIKAHQCGTTAVHLHAFNLQDKEWLVISGGDDNALCSSLIRSCSKTNPTDSGLHLTLQATYKYENAHISSIRDVRLDFPYIFSLGWDKKLRVWELVENRLPKFSYKDTFRINVPDPAGMCSWEQKKSENNTLRMAVFGGASGIEAFDIAYQSDKL